MNLEKKQEKRYMGILLLLVFAGSLFLLSFISYSDPSRCGSTSSVSIAPQWD